MKDDISFHDTQIYVHTMTYIHNILYPHMHAYHYIHYIHFIGYMHDIHQIHCTHYIITQIPLHTMTATHGLSMRNLRNLSEKNALHIGQLEVQPSLHECVGCCCLETLPVSEVSWISLGIFASKPSKRDTKPLDLTSEYK